MLKQQEKLFFRLNIFIDLFVICTAFSMAFLFRSYLSDNLYPFNNYVWILAISLPVWSILILRNSLYASIREISLLEISTRLFNVHFVCGVIGAAFIYFFDRLQFSRSLYLCFVIFSFLALLVKNLILKLFLEYAQKKNFTYRNILIVGTFEKAVRFQTLVKQHSGWGLNIVGFVQAIDDPNDKNLLEYEILGKIEDLVGICKSTAVDEVVFCLPNTFVGNIESYLNKLEEMGVTARLVMDFYDLTLYRKELSFFHGELPILTFHPKEFDSSQLFAKRSLDVFGATVGLFLLVLMYPFIAVAIKVNTPGPVFFRQLRIGENGRSFNCWKFRSMYVDAEERKSDLFNQNEMNGAIFKIKNDPRVTKVGEFLRKTSLDEFPQFWNVLKGEMSLVGTRPPTPEEVTAYENWHRRRISIKPGITGLWQISGRNKIEDFDEVVRLDLTYIDKWNLWLDITVLLKTFWVVLKREGSC